MQQPLQVKRCNAFLFFIFQILILFFHSFNLIKITILDKYILLSASERALCFSRNSLLEVFPISSKSNINLFMRDINKCMKNRLNKTYSPTNTEEALSHYQMLNNFFESYNYIQRPAYCGCKGPFLENEFIRRFKTKPLSYFSPFIPLLFPWFGIFVNLSSVNYSRETSKIMKLLKPNYLYFVLSESDWGFLLSPNFLKFLPKNIFVFSASGMGHVAIPWISCEIQPPKGPIEKKYFLSFCGKFKNHRIRFEIVRITSKLFGSDFYQDYTKDWIDVFSKSKFILSPRGVAVGTYRTYEILRMEEIPVIVTDKFHWLPYYPRLNWCKFAILTTLQELPNITDKLRNIKDEDYMEMRNTLHAVSKKYFQWDGVFEQIDMFFNSSNHSFSCSRGALT